MIEAGSHPDSSRLYAARTHGLSNGSRWARRPASAAIALSWPREAGRPGRSSSQAAQCKHYGLTPSIAFRFLNKLFASSSRAAAHPEHAFRVWDKGDELLCQFRDGPVEVLRWDDLAEIRIVTTDEGPMLPDVFWAFIGSSGRIVFPEMAHGYEAIRDRAMKMAGFDFDQSLAAMRSTSNAEFLVWTRK